MAPSCLNSLDAQIRCLQAELDGVRGAVLREVDADSYQRKQQELQAAIREYYLALYGDRVSMP